MWPTIIPPHGCRGWIALLLVTLVGCAGNSHFPVSGHITLDGSPLPQATVSYLPTRDEGIPAVGRTDDNGDYIIQESSDLKGLEPGSYRVRITTYDEGDLDAEPPLPRVRERVPVQYNLDTTLTAEVKEQENTFDFQLESKGEIYQQ